MPRFDFTIGDEPYKRDWCDIEQKLYDHVAVASWRGWPAVQFSSGWRRAKRAIKHNAVLWGTVVRARETIARLRKRDE
jgi:CelD/BcsL family acetyltransferase involved in cellulose biosynthesis